MKHDNNETTEKVKAILNKHGVSERQHIKTVASILNIAYVSSRQKFSSDRAWTNDQLSRIAAYFREPIESLVCNYRPSVGNGILHVSGMPKRCVCEIGLPVTVPEAEELVTYQEGDVFIVLPGSQIRNDIRYFSVSNIRLLPPPVIAALDDNPDVPQSIADVFSRKGISVKQFVDSETLIAEAKYENFEYYILDWVLGDDKTAEAAISIIRSELSASVPIIVLTGELRTDKVQDSDLAKMVQLYDISVLEKPALLETIATTVYKRLFFRSLR
ncbi:helix-turn-helix domain-containing protein [Caballeronia calidae]|nr:helix-turn-helix domain-containing protein [Caballeronia calidae]